MYQFLLDVSISFIEFLGEKSQVIKAMIFSQENYFIESYQVSRVEYILFPLDF